MLFSDEQVGRYIKLLCLQHQKGHLSEKNMLSVCKKYDEDIFNQFEKDNEGKYYNRRLDKEITKREKYSQSRSQNASSKNTSLFNECWVMFGKYGLKSKALAYWNKLKDEDQQNIKKRIPIYLQSLRRTGYPKKCFEGWINPKNRIWETTTYDQATPNITTHRDSLDTQELKSWALHTKGK